MFRIINSEGMNTTGMSIKHVMLGALHIFCNSIYVPSGMGEKV